MQAHPFYKRLSEYLEKKGLYDPQYDDPDLLKRGFTADQLKSLNDVIASFYQRIMDDPRLEQFHPLFTGGRKTRFQKNLTRFTLFLMTLTYEEFVLYVFRTMVKHNTIELEMHLLMEYFYVWSNGVTQWCCTHFDHDKPAILARSQKMNVLAFLFISAYDKVFMDEFEEQFKAYEVTPLQHDEVIKEHMEEVDRLLESTTNASKVDYFASMLTDIAKMIASAELQGKSVVVKVMKNLILFIKKHPDEIVRHPASGLLIKDIMRWLDQYSADVEQGVHSRRFYLTGLTMEVELFKANMVRYEMPIIDDDINVIPVEGVEESPDREGESRAISPEV